MGVVDDPAEVLAAAGERVVYLVDRLSQRGKALGHGFQPGGRHREPGPLLLRGLAGRLLRASRSQPLPGQETDHPQPGPRTEQGGKGVAGRLNAERPGHAAARVGGQRFHPPARGQQGCRPRGAGEPGSRRGKFRVHSAERRPRGRTEGQRSPALSLAAEEIFSRRAGGHPQHQRAERQTAQSRGTGHGGQQGARAGLFGREAPQPKADGPGQQGIRPTEEQQFHAAALRPKGEAERTARQRGPACRCRREKAPRPEPAARHDRSQPAEQADALQTQRPKAVEQQPQCRSGRAGRKAVLPQAQSQAGPKGEQRPV